MKKRILSIVLLAAMLFSMNPAQQAVAAQSAPDIEGTSAVIVDAKTGETLWQKDAGTVRPVASMTKVMAAYLVYEAIQEGRITMETPVPISTYTYYFSRDNVYSNIPFQWDKVYTVRDMLEAFLCYSACAAGPALGELLYGSEESFVAAMNAKAQEWGLAARFDQSYDEGYMSAQAMAAIAKHVLDEQPEMLEITALKEFEFGGKIYPSSNALLDENDASIGTVDGLKTGWTPMAGSCMAATSSKNGMRLITVTMNASAVNARYSDSEKLLRYGFSLLEERLQEGYAYATPNIAAVNMNGGQLSMQAYMADGNNYVRLRDFAAVLNGTGSQFGLSYDAATGTVVINNGAPYDGTNSGGSLEGGPVMSQLRQPVVRVDGQDYAIDAYLIGDLNYMKIRDLCDAIGCGIDWDPTTGQVILLPKATTATADASQQAATDSTVAADAA
ncbi:MAG: serine hydrolase [Peptococcaceae bacterium]|nr:serine hydrolase [Peptococcaceae bacterium]